MLCVDDVVFACCCLLFLSWLLLMMFVVVVVSCRCLVVVCLRFAFDVAIGCCCSVIRWSCVF